MAAAAGGVPADIEDANKVMCAGKMPKFPKVEAGKTYYYCTCGRSKTNPWCDGSHAGTSFQPLPYTAEKTGSIKVCMCKSTKTAPICDNSHVKLLLPGCCGGVSVKTGALYDKL
eukprot:GHVU01095713.1.p2 GENE.GHVU01095713.1~~GHVU01095713.1.p2  ORF type:complete len:129 (-),score=23.92 GHVU01095713.1:335-676(-)